MSLWVLDTDHVSLFLRGNPYVRDRILQVSTDIAITIITVQEVFNGWITEINDPSQAAHLVDLYTRLWLALDYFKSIRVCNFDQAADDCHNQLLQSNPSLMKKRLQKDMRIAAIAIAIGATLVTRNHRDFSQVPGLLLEDWSQY